MKRRNAILLLALIAPILALGLWAQLRSDVTRGQNGDGGKVIILGQRRLAAPDTATWCAVSMRPDSSFALGKTAVRLVVDVNKVFYVHYISANVRGLCGALLWAAGLPLDLPLADIQWEAKAPPGPQVRGPRPQT